MEDSHVSLVETHQPLLLHGAGRAIGPVVAGARRISSNRHRRRSSNL
jgi:hypothetical protein